MLHEQPITPDLCPDVNQVMTREEMFARFPEEHLLVVNPELDARQTVQKGLVVCHTKIRDLLAWKFDQLDPRPGRVATLFTGPTPPGMEFLL
jgi:hypothetical protein